MAGIVVPSAYALTLAAAQAADLPVILWQTIAAAADYSADEEATGYPATNLANPSTIEGWRGTSTDPQTITVALDGSIEIEGIGIERHNFGSGLVTVEIEGLAPEGDPEEPTHWSVIVAEHIPAGDGTVIYVFDPGHYDAIRLNLTPSATIPRLAVLWVGPVLRMERGVQPHTPIGWGIRRTVQTGRSQSGDFLGRVITDATRQASAQFSYLTPEWLRESDWLAFASAAATSPFFFAWAPETYPTEVGFCWALNDIVASVNHLAGYAEATIEMEGVLA